jgi:hypothetical protein
MATNKHRDSLALFLMVTLIAVTAVPAYGQAAAKKPAVAARSANSSLHTSASTIPATAAPPARILLVPDRDMFKTTLPWDEGDEDGAENLEEANPNHDIKMHGHWVIDVKNPDGTLAEHRAFENSITIQGASFLFGLMAGYYVAGDYAISLQPPGIVFGPAPCTNVLANNSGACVIVRSLSTNPALGLCGGNGGFYCTTGLTYTPNLLPNYLFAFYTSITLAGSITANQAGMIGTVSTLFGACQNSTPTTPSTTVTTLTPATCVTNTGSGTSFSSVLSQANIAPISLTSGQLVQVTVTISFT